MTESKSLRVRADFNGLFGDLLCQSHEDTCRDANGNLVALHAGMTLSAFDEDLDENGNRDDLIHMVARLGELRGVNRNVRADLM
jgi:hypothetical protein